MFRIWDIEDLEDLQLAADLFAEEKNEGVRPPTHLTLKGGLGLDEPLLISIIETLTESEPNVKTLSLTFDTANYEDDTVDRFCDAIGNLKGLEWIKFEKTETPMHFMNSLIRRVPGIKNLSFGVDLNGNTNDFQDFAAALSACTKILALDFGSCRISDDVSLVEINPVLQAISSLPNILIVWRAEKLIPKGWHGKEPSADLLLPLSTFLGHSSCRPLEMTPTNPEQLAVFASTIKYHHLCPKEVTIWLQSSAEVLKDLVVIVSHAQSGLKKLKIQLREPHVDPKHFAQFVEAMGENSTLESFSLFFRRRQNAKMPYDEELLNCFALMLDTKNWKITKLEVDTNRWDSDRKIWGTPPILASLQRIKYNTELNWLGRSKFLQKTPNGASKEDWIAMLHRARNDLSSLYYFLSMNPCLCDGCGEADDDEEVGAIRTRTRKRRRISEILSHGQ